MKKDEMVVCVACGAVNRLPSGKNSLAGRCGKCGEKLFSGTPAPVGTAIFDRLVSKGTLPVIVDIWAPWCGPCHTMAPEFQKATQVLEPRARFVKIDSDSEQQLASRLEIRSIPTLIAFRSGREIARQSGAMTSSQIVSWLNALLY